MLTVWLRYFNWNTSYTAVENIQYEAKDWSIFIKRP